jgi:hypothetical protein
MCGRNNMCYRNPKDSCGMRFINGQTVCRLVFEAVHLRCVYRKRRRNAAEHEKEKTNEPQTSAKFPIMLLINQE